MNKTALVEAMLFTAIDPISFEELEKASGARREELERILESLKNKYNTEESGLRLFEAGGYKLIVKHEYAGHVSHLTPHADLSRGVLRVLSIIAYHQPIGQADIVKIVGNRTYEYVKELAVRGFVKADKRSRTKVLSTTKHFEEYFGAKADEIKKMGNKNDRQSDDKL
ncbi:MAG: SMC-Scp complex subunit ScpB [Candidatus Aenigmarchaeota archaeon]|nr:SMC-Scp complex subunit ScpB [Candidatus Aenigmarchaeota archaeon]